MIDHNAQSGSQQSFTRKSVERFEAISRKPYVQGLPEWSMFPDEESRRAAIKEIERGMMPRSIKDVFVFLIVVTLFLAIPLLVADGVTTYLLPAMGRWNDHIKWILTVLGYIALVYLGLRRDMPKALRKQLIKSGVPVCVKCGYDLRGLPADSAKCPECGRDFDDNVGELIRASSRNRDPERT